LVLQTPSEDATIRKIFHKINSVFHSEFGASLFYTKRIGGHVQCFSKKSIIIFLERHNFKILNIHDSTYGLRYMLKKTSSGIKHLILPVLGIVGYILGFLDHRNHMTVYAKKG